MERTTSARAALAPKRLSSTPATGRKPPSATKSAAPLKTVFKKRMGYGRPSLRISQKPRDRRRFGPRRTTIRVLQAFAYLASRLAGWGLFCAAAWPLRHYAEKESRFQLDASYHQPTRSSRRP